MDDAFHLTVLGTRGIRSVLPLGYVAGAGQLLRDLLSFDEDDALIGQWSSMDHLLLMCLLSDRHPKVRAFGEKLAHQVDAWHASTQLGSSLLFRTWVAGSASSSRADELCGSIGRLDDSADRRAARKRGYLAMLNAIVLMERANGAGIADLEHRWGLKNLGGVEEAWRDTSIWLLAGQARLFALRCFYHHLLSDCGAGAARMKRVKPALQRARGRCFEVIEGVKYCSPLGPMILGVKAMRQEDSGPSVGIGTVRRLEAAGVTSFAALGQLDEEALVDLGVRRNFASQIVSYCRLKMR